LFITIVLSQSVTFSLLTQSLTHSLLTILVASYSITYLLTHSCRGLRLLPHSSPRYDLLCNQIVYSVPCALTHLLTHAVTLLTSPYLTSPYLSSPHLTASTCYCSILCYPIKRDALVFSVIPLKRISTCLRSMNKNCISAPSVEPSKHPSNQPSQGVYRQDIITSFFPSILLFFYS
jgi:hypothetical protein